MTTESKAFETVLALVAASIGIPVEELRVHATEVRNIKPDFTDAEVLAVLAKICSQGKPGAVAAKDAEIALLRAEKATLEQKLAEAVNENVRKLFEPLPFPIPAPVPVAPPQIYPWNPYGPPYITKPWRPADHGGMCACAQCCTVTCRPTWNVLASGALLATAEFTQTFTTTFTGGAAPGLLSSLEKLHATHPYFQTSPLSAAGPLVEGTLPSLSGVTSSSSH